MQFEVFLVQGQDEVAVKVIQNPSHP